MAKKKGSKLLNSLWIYVPVVLIGSPILGIIFVNALMAGVIILLGDLIMKCQNIEQKKGLIILFGVLSGFFAVIAPFLALITVSVSFFTIPWISAVSIGISVSGIAAAKAAGFKGLIAWLLVVAAVGLSYYGKKLFLRWKAKRAEQGVLVN
jgi:hypothetical protein